MRMTTIVGTPLWRRLADATLTMLLGTLLAQFAMTSPARSDGMYYPPPYENQGYEYPPPPPAPVAFPHYCGPCSCRPCGGCYPGPCVPHPRIVEKVRIDREVTHIVRFYPPPPLPPGPPLPPYPHVPRPEPFNEGYLDDPPPPLMGPIPVPVPRPAAWSYGDPGAYGGPGAYGPGAYGEPGPGPVDSLPAPSPHADSPAYNYGEGLHRDYLPNYDHPWWEEPGVRR